MAVIFLMMLVIHNGYAEVTRVKFPANLDQLVHYATVRRGEVTEHIMTTKEAIESIKKKKPTPIGTKVVLVDYRGGKVYRYFVMEKGEGWGKDYDARRRTGDWQYQWFWGDKTINMKEDTARCMSCHQPQEDADYLYTGYRIPHFNGKPVE